MVIYFFIDKFYWRVETGNTPKKGNMRIKIITTGGTIEGLDYDNELDKPSIINNQIQRFFEIANVQFDYTFEYAFSKDSRFITEKDRRLLEKIVFSSSEERILITHGTFTMAQTAEFLGKREISKTIVLVGSFISGDEPDTDAPFNLGYAISTLQNLENGVYVAMNGTVFSWDNVVKNDSENRFQSNN